jgi:hypothetical protein
LTGLVIAKEDAVVQIIFPNFVEERIDEVCAGHNVER